MYGRVGAVCPISLRSPAVLISSPRPFWARVDDGIVAGQIHRNVVLSGDVAQRVGQMGKGVKLSPLAQLQYLLKVAGEDDIHIQVGKVDVGKIVHPADAVQGAKDKVEAVAAQNLLCLFLVLDGLSHLDAVHDHQTVVERLAGFSGFHKRIAQAQVCLGKVLVQFIVVGDTQSHQLFLLGMFAQKGASCPSGRGCQRGSYTF